MLRVQTFHIANGMRLVSPIGEAPDETHAMQAVLGYLEGGGPEVVEVVRLSDDGETIAATFDPADQEVRAAVGKGLFERFAIDQLYRPNGFITINPCALDSRRLN